MENSRIKDLEKELENEKRKAKKKTTKDLEVKTGFKIGSIVEAVDAERINDYDYEHTWIKTEVVGFNDCGKDVYLILKNTYKQHFLPTKVRLFNDDDYTLRHSLWDRELDIDDEIKLIVDKPKSTKGKVYQVFKVIKEKKLSNRILVL